MDAKQELWGKLQKALSRQNFPQALLFVGPLHCQLAEFSLKVAQLVLCKEHQDTPCDTCMDCQMIQRMEHPDVLWVRPEKMGAAIKIDQIRSLQYSAYLTPQRTTHRFIIIEAADRMNVAAANALLKILEEPTQHTIFILIAQQLGSVKPTVLSRCQITTFTTQDDSLTGNILALGSYYPEGSAQAELFKQQEIIIEELIDIIEGRKHPCSVAARWSQLEFEILLWFLYLVYTQIQYLYCMKVTLPDSPVTMKLQSLSTLLNPVLIFTQIDKINTLLRKINFNMNMNQTLALEDLLTNEISGSLG